MKFSISALGANFGGALVAGLRGCPGHNLDGADNVALLGLFLCLPGPWGWRRS